MTTGDCCVLSTRHVLCRHRHRTLPDHVPDWGGRAGVREVGRCVCVCSAASSLALVCLNSGLWRGAGNRGGEGTFLLLQWEHLLRGQNPVGDQSQVRVSMSVWMSPRSCPSG